DHRRNWLALPFGNRLPATTPSAALPRRSRCTTRVPPALPSSDESDWEAGRGPCLQSNLRRRLALQQGAWLVPALQWSLSPNRSSARAEPHGHAELVINRSRSDTTPFEHLSSAARIPSAAPRKTRRPQTAYWHWRTPPSAKKATAGLAAAPRDLRLSSIRG